MLIGDCMFSFFGLLEQLSVFHNSKIAPEYIHCLKQAVSAPLPF